MKTMDPAALASDKWSAQLRKGCLELAILSSLRQEPRYGLHILRTLQDTGGMAVAEGTLYPILNRLREDGLVVSEWRDTGAGHPRKYYTLTTAGRQRTKDMSSAWRDFVEQMNSVIDGNNRRGARHV